MTTTIPGLVGTLPTPPVCLQSGPSGLRHELAIARPTTLNNAQALQVLGKIF